jgi:hypothetical protein
MKKRKIQVTIHYVLSFARPRRLACMAVGSFDICHYERRW